MIQGETTIVVFTKLPIWKLLNEKLLHELHFIVKRKIFFNKNQIRGKYRNKNEFRGFCQQNDFLHFTVNLN